MNSQDNSQWILECKFGTMSGDLIGELRRGRLIYDNISRNFEAYHYTVKHELKQKVTFIMRHILFYKHIKILGKIFYRPGFS